MKGECGKCGGCAYDYPRCYCRFGSAPIKTDEEILKCLEDILIRLRHIKHYVTEQKQLMLEKYPNETHGYQVLHYLHKSLLGFVKENDE